MSTVRGVWRDEPVAEVAVIIVKKHRTIRSQRTVVAAMEGGKDNPKLQYGRIYTCETCGHAEPRRWLRVMLCPPTREQLEKLAKTKARIARALELMAQSRQPEQRGVLFAE